jgi:beta-1,4-galactosyltransferase 4
LVVQSDKKLFNRAKLLNIGVKHSDPKADYFIFHDVDLLPSPTVDYTYPRRYVEHLAWQIVGGKFYPYNFGGATKISKDAFLKVNGFSNEYWGWGAEDDDFYRRCLFSKLFEDKPTRSQSGLYGHIHCRKELGSKHKRYDANVERLHKMEEKKIDFLKEGFNTLQGYEIIKKEIRSEYPTVQLLYVQFNSHDAVDE